MKLTNDKAAQAVTLLDEAAVNLYAAYIALEKLPWGTFGSGSVQREVRDLIDRVRARESSLKTQLAGTTEG